MSLTDDQSTDKTREEPKVDRRRRPERRIEILKAVMTLLEKGNRRVTTAELAAEVGLSEAALYRHFTGKDAIFQALIDFLRDHLLRSLDPPFDSALPMERLRRQFENHLQFFAEHPGLCRIFLVEGVMTRAESMAMNRIVREYGKQVQTIMANAQELGELPVGLDLESAADFYVGLIQAATLRFVISGFTASPMADAGAAWNYFCRGVGVVEHRSAA
ncbi:MAG: TetR family transcriptional regulator [Magnetococcales bacterium]|nr:TetR family transcriptional regulator [Magnetococcales bacterium]